MSLFIPDTCLLLVLWSGQLTVIRYCSISTQDLSSDCVPVSLPESPTPAFYAIRSAPHYCVLLEWVPSC